MSGSNFHHSFFTKHTKFFKVICFLENLCNILAAFSNTSNKNKNIWAMGFPFCTCCFKDLFSRKQSCGTLNFSPLNFITADDYFIIGFGIINRSINVRNVNGKETTQQGMKSSKLENYIKVNAIVHSFDYIWILWHINDLTILT